MSYPISSSTTPTNPLVGSVVSASDILVSTHDLPESGSPDTGDLYDSSGAKVTGCSVLYSEGTISINPARQIVVKKPRFSTVSMGTAEVSSTTNNNPPMNTSGSKTTQTTYREVFSGWDNESSVYTFPQSGGYVVVSYRDSSSSQQVEEQPSIDGVRIDLTPWFAETIVQGSVRFTMGGKTYIDRSGSLYCDVDPATGAGTLAGTISYSTGECVITSWAPGASPAVTVQSLVTELNAQPVDEMTFRIPVIPVRADSVSIRAVPITSSTGAFVSVSVPASGLIVTDDMFGTVDFQTGLVYLRFGKVVPVDNTVKAQSWYSDSATFTYNGVLSIVQPKMVWANSVNYSAVGYTPMPLDSSILGLNPVRLPSDGRVPIFSNGTVAVIHNTKTTPFPANASAGTILDVGRVRLSYIKVYDQKGVLVDPNLYSNDLEAGTCTLASNFAIGSYVAPLVAEHRIEDMLLVTDVQINGKLASNKLITHSYPAGESYVSSALVMGDLQARVYNVFSQDVWNGVWSESLIGKSPIAQYNIINYPMIVTNRGAVEEDWAIIFTSPTNYRVVGKDLGQVAVGDINSDCSPINPATGAPYFTISALGWGGGWSAGNALRFNTAAANSPIWVARTVLQGVSSANSDSFQLQLRGDIDA